MNNVTVSIQEEYHERDCIVIIPYSNVSLLGFFVQKSLMALSG